MKRIKSFFSLIILMVLSAPIFSQNGNLVISEVQVYDAGNNIGMVKVRVSGNLASSVTGGSFSSGSGDRVAVSLLTVQPSANVPGNGQILMGSFPLMPAIGNEPRFVNLDIEVQAATRPPHKAKAWMVNNYEVHAVFGL